MGNILHKKNVKFKTEEFYLRSVSSFLQLCEYNGLTKSKSSSTKENLKKNIELKGIIIYHIKNCIISDCFCKSTTPLFDFNQNKYFNNSG